MENVIENIEDSIITGDDPGAVETSDGKLFSQEQVNDIIKERLSKEKEKNQRQFEALQKEFQQKELNLHAKELLTSKGLPLDILEALKYEDQETLDKSVDVIVKAMQEHKKTGEVITKYEPTAGLPPSPDDAIRKAMNLKQ